MKIIVFICCMLTITSMQSQTINIMSFNIRCGNCDLNNENNWNSRKEMVVKVITDKNPDLIGFQEVIPAQLEYLEAQLPDYKIFGSGREADRLGEGCYIFYKKERFSLDSSNASTIWYSSTPNVPGSADMGDIYKRIISYALFTDKQTGKKFYHFNTHLTYIDSIQERYTDFLIKNIAERKISAPVILTGDFNADENSVSIKKLKQPIGKITLTDSYREVIPSGEASTFHGFTGKGDGLKIDYIFIQDNFFKALSSSIIHDNKNGKYPSDHFAIEAKLQYK